MFSPGRRIEEDQHGEQFQTTGQHVEHEDEFGEHTEDGEVLCGTYQIKAGTDIVQCRNGSCKIRGESVIVNT